MSVVQNILDLQKTLKPFKVFLTENSYIVIDIEATIIADFKLF